MCSGATYFLSTVLLMYLHLDTSASKKKGRGAWGETTKMSNYSYLLTLVFQLFGSSWPLLVWSTTFCFFSEKNKLISNSDFGQYKHMMRFQISQSQNNFHKVWSEYWNGNGKACPWRYKYELMVTYIPDRIYQCKPPGGEHSIKYWNRMWTS